MGPTLEEAACESPWNTRNRKAHPGPEGENPNALPALAVGAAERAWALGSQRSGLNPSSVVELWGNPCPAPSLFSHL